MVIRTLAVLTVACWTLTAGSELLAQAADARSLVPGQNPDWAQPGVYLGSPQMRKATAIQIAARSLQSAQKGLAEANDDEARAAATKALKAALDSYFVADLAKRRAELDAIKARVAKMESLLRKRIESKDEIIALRMQVLIDDSDGLGWSGNALQSRPSITGLSRSGYEYELPGTRSAAPGLRTR